MDICTRVQSFAIKSSLTDNRTTGIYVYDCQDFGGTSLVNYDRRQAAATGVMTTWSRVNGTLHHVCFNGPCREPSTVNCVWQPHLQQKIVHWGPRTEIFKSFADS